MRECERERERENWNSCRNCYGCHETHCETVSATLSQATCLCVVGEFVYIATTSGCLIVVDANSLLVSAICQTYTHMTAIVPLTADDHQSQPSELSRDRRPHMLLATIGRGFSDLVHRTVAQYTSSSNSCDNSVLCVWSDAHWNARVNCC